MAISTGAAILGGAIVSAAVGSRSAKKASRAQTKAAKAGITEQQRQFDITTGLQRPIFEAGDLARNELLASLGLSGQEAESDFFNRFKETRGQQFLREKQEKATTRNAAALGQRLGGNVLTALQEQAEGRAAGRLGEFQNRLAGIAGSGQVAATTTGQLGAQKSSNVANLLTQSGQAKATGILGQNQALQQGISGAFTGAAQSGSFSDAQKTLPASNFDPFSRVA